MERSVCDLKIGEEGIIKHISDPSIAKVLISMGVLPNMIARLIRKSPLGGSVYLRIDNQSIAIRKADAKHIMLA